jgi:hypothetical protein
VWTKPLQSHFLAIHEKVDDGKKEQDWTHYTILLLHYNIILYAMTATEIPAAPPTAKEAASPSSKRRCRIFKVRYMLLAIAIFIIKQFKRPLEDYAGVQVNFKVPAVIRPTNESLLVQETAFVFTGEDEELAESSDESQDASHDSPLHEVAPPIVKQLEEYQFMHSQQQLEQELKDCQERTNSEVGHTIAHAVKEGWCPEFVRRSFLLVTLDCQSPERLLLYLRTLPWAIVTNRTLLWKRSETCNGLLEIRDWVAPYAQWEKELHLGSNSTITVDISEVDAVDARVIKIANPTTLTPAHLERVFSREKARVLMTNKPFMYGMLLDESLEFDMRVLPPSLDLRDELDAYLYAVEAVESQQSSPDCMQGVIESPCVVYQVGPASVDSMIEPYSCQVRRVDSSEQGANSTTTFVHNLALTGQARNGVVVSRTSAFNVLLVYLISYRGQLEDSRNFKLSTCLFSKERS